MMTYQQAKDFQARLTDDTRKLSRTRKAELVEIRRAELLAEGFVWESGGPQSKNELVNDILNRRYPLEQVNETIHVLYHAPSARWSACDHCQAKPETENVNTPQLRAGDVVLINSMRVRVDAVREYWPTGAPEGPHEWACPGTVLNAAAVLAEHKIPASFLQRYGYVEGSGFVVESEDAWTIYGTESASWTVESPRPPEPVAERAAAERAAAEHERELENWSWQ